MQQLEAFRRDDFDTAFGFASGANGREIEAVYEMVREERGWRIMATHTVCHARRTSFFGSRPVPIDDPPSRQNNPTTLPSASTSMVSAPGVFGSPGIVRMSPA